MIDPQCTCISANRRSRDAITGEAILALERIARAIRQNPGTGQVRRLVLFVAGCYNGTDFPFDLTELRGLDDDLACACIAYLDYDRLGIREIHRLQVFSESELHAWFRRYDLVDDPSGGSSGRTCA